MDFYGGRRNADIFLSTYFEIKERKVDGKDSFSRVNLANLKEKFDRGRSKIYIVLFNIFLKYI